MRKSKEFDNVLNECLERLLVKRESIEDCLQSYPEHADKLKPLLDAALSIKKASDVEPRPEFSARARYQFRLALQEAKAKRGRRFFFGWQPIWATVVTTVLVVLVASSATVAAAGNSMPDEPLYPVKLATEQVQLMVTPSSLGKAELHAKLAERRVAEIIHLASKSKPGQIELATRRLDVSLAKIAALSRAPAKEAGVFQAPAPRMAPSERAPSARKAPEPSMAPSEQAPSAEKALVQRIKDRAKLRAALARYARTHPEARPRIR